MNSRVFTILALLMGVASAKNTRGNAAFTRVFAEQNGNGNYMEFNDYADNLAAYGFDNTIDSVFQTGMWMYYDNTFYSAPGSVYWVHGIDISVNFPMEYSNTCSSLRYAGSPDYSNEDTWTVYEGELFTGSEYYGNQDSVSLGNLDNQGSSIIVTGLSPWTFYDGNSYTGSSLCVYPNTDTDENNGQILNFGIYPRMSDIGIPDNAIQSVKKGCWSDKVAPRTRLHVDGVKPNGAWGRITL